MAAPRSEPVTRAMWLTLAAMTVSASMILVDQTAVPLATPRAVSDLGGSLSDSPWLPLALGDRALGALARADPQAAAGAYESRTTRSTMMTTTRMPTAAGTIGRWRAQKPGSARSRV
jgi:hypothetical protein